MTTCEYLDEIFRILCAEHDERVEAGGPRNPTPWHFLAALPLETRRELEALHDAHNADSVWFMRALDSGWVINQTPRRGLWMAISPDGQTHLSNLADLRARYPLSAPEGLV